MRNVFADTSFHVALLSRQDALRESAVAFMASYTGAVVTTEFVLLELGNFLSHSKRRSKLQPFIERLRGEAGTHVIPLTGNLFDLGLDLYANRADKQWSLTDCISFVVMQDHGLTDALTADHHFEQAGFNVLLK